MLGDRDVDDLVGVDERRVDRPLVEHLALQAHRAEAMLGGQDDLGAELVRGLRQMPERWKQRFGSLHEASVTTTRLAPASNASCTTVADDVGVRVRRVDRHAIPADVRLDDDDVAARDEALHAAERVDRAPRQGGGVGLVLRDDELGKLEAARPSSRRKSRTCRAPSARWTSMPPWSQRRRPSAAAPANVRPAAPRR